MGAERNHIVIDIEPLNDAADIAVFAGAADGFELGSCMGLVVQEGRHCFAQSNNNYPISKYYREGRARIKQITVRLRNLDGSLYEPDGADHLIALRLTRSATHAKKVVFPR